MNLAFLLISTACTPAAPPPPAAAPAVVTPAPVYSTSSSCGGSCDGGCGAVSDCCDSGGKHSFLDRCRGLFGGGHGHGSSCGCNAAPTCCGTVAPAPTCCGTTSSCGGGHGHGSGLFSGMFNRGHGHGHGSSCGCASAPVSCGCAAVPVSCGSCGDACSGGCGGKPSFFDRCKAHLGGLRHGHGGGGCCGATTSCCDGGPVGAIPGGTIIGSAPVSSGSAPIVTSPVIGSPYAPRVIGSPVISPVPTTTVGPESLRRMPTPAVGPVAPVAPAVIPAPVTIPPAAPTTAPRPTVTPASATSNETDLNRPFEPSRRRDERAGHAADYSRLTGQLYRAHVDGGLWVLRYAPLGQEDRHGGSVILANDRQLGSYKDGDLVTVHGSIVSERGSTRLSGPLYSARTIELVDRPLP